MMMVKGKPLGTAGEGRCTALSRGLVAGLTAALLVVALLSGQGLRAANERYVHQVVSDFDEPWAMAFLPDGRLLITEKRGELMLLAEDGTVSAVTGVPEVAYGGQGGLGDVALHPDFAQNGLVYLSYVEPGDGVKGAAVARARLQLENRGGALTDLEVIWRQVPKVSGSGHYAYRILFGPQGYLWISSGDRQKFDPAQDMGGNLGKILRLNHDGSIPADNPFFDRGGVAAEVWSLGHRNPLGMAFDQRGQLWNVEMGPEGGDELNRVMRAENYGYPVVSDGDHYDGRDIPDHDTRPEFSPPAISWTPVISPSSMIFYSGSQLPHWQGSAVIGGLSAQGLVRVEVEGATAREIERVPLGARIRDVEQGPEGAIWVLEDGKRGSEGRLLKLTSAQ
jgi:glucose/arabinose dehydrogenase